MSNLILGSLLPTIHSTVRRKLVSEILGHREELCLLDFIGASNYFITEYGVVWHKPQALMVRQRFKSRPLHTDYLPLVIKDRYTLTQWVQIPTDLGKIWFPVTQLLGWAYSPTTDRTQRYFVAKSAGYPVHYSNLTLTSTNPVTRKESLYNRFMSELYAIEDAQTN